MGKEKERGRERQSRGGVGCPQLWSLDPPEEEGKGIGKG